MDDDTFFSSDPKNQWMSLSWGFPKIGVPQNGWFIMENPIKRNDLRVPLFLETPKSMDVVELLLFFVLLSFEQNEHLKHLLLVARFFCCQSQSFCGDPQISLRRYGRIFHHLVTWAPKNLHQSKLASFLLKKSPFLRGYLW